MESLRSVLYSLQYNDKRKQVDKVLTITTKMNFIFLLKWNILPIKNIILSTV